MSLPANTSPPVRRKRQAQAWARVIVEGIELFIENTERAEQRPAAVLFPLELSMEAVPRGKGIRMCQEVNLAKSQFTEEIQRIREYERMSPAEKNQVDKPPVVAFLPSVKPIWVLKARVLENGMVKFYVEAPTGRKRAESSMLGEAISFVESQMGTSPSGGRPDPLANYLSREAVGSNTGTAGIPPEEDPQEALLANYLKG